MKHLSMQQRREIFFASWRLWLYGSLPDLLVISGGGLVTYGSYLIYAPAGFIVGGSLMIAAGFLASRRLQ